MGVYWELSHNVCFVLVLSFPREAEDQPQGLGLEETMGQVEAMPVASALAHVNAAELDPQIRSQALSPDD